MRVDYFHTGNTTQELFSLDEAVVEPAAWPGPANAAADPLNYGAYGFDVRDAASKQLLHSRGFGSIYDEWVTTEEAKAVTRTFHESVRFPMPSAPVTLSIRKRGPRNTWRDVWTAGIDPKGMFVNTAVPDPSPGPLIELEKNGDPATKVDLLLLGDGYTAAERPKFETDAKRLVNVLFDTSPFKERRTDFNVWGLVPASRESGISRPSLGIHRANPVSSTYDAFGSERYILAFDNKAFRRLASFAPYDVVEIVVDGPSRRWKRYSRKSARATKRCSRHTMASSAPMKARSMKRRGTSGRKPTASCSRARTSSARSAGGHSQTSSTLTPDADGTSY